MKIWMHRYLNGTAHSFLEINEELLNDVNKDLTNNYVIANNLSEAPQIESVEKLEQIFKEYQYQYKYNDECPNNYNILCKRFIKEDGTLRENINYESLYDVVYEFITDYLFDEPFELDKYETIDYNFEIEENNKLIFL